MCTEKAIATKNPLLFSIIMPVYNGEKTVSTAIESVISQDCLEWELIIIDDGSEDNTEDVLLSYSINDTRIIVIHQSNQGPFQARLKGVEMAKGKYICFLDADDYYESNLLSSCKITLEKESGIDILFFNTIFSINGIKKVYDRPTKNQIVSVEEFIISCLNCGQLFTGIWNKIFKKDLFNFYTQKSDQVFRYAEDTYFVMKCIENTRCVYYLDKYLYNYIRNDKSDNITGNINSFDVFNEVSVFNSFLSEPYINMRIINSLDLFYLRYYSSIFNFIHLSKKEKKGKSYIICNLKKMYNVRINKMFLKKKNMLVKKKHISKRKVLKIWFFTKRLYLFIV